MNRRKFFFQTLAASTTILLGSQMLYSCKKDPVPVVGDFIDQASIVKLDAAVMGAATLSDVPADLQTAAETITTIMTQAEVDTYSSVDMNPVIQFYKSNIVISSEEKTMLLANDPSALSKVLNRMYQMPSFTKDEAVSNSSNAIAKNAEISSYRSANTSGGSDLYAGQYYQCALDNQTFIQDNTIAKLEKIASLKATASKSASIIGSTPSHTVSEQRIIALLMVLTLAELHELTHVMQLMRAKLEKLHIGG